MDMSMLKTGPLGEEINPDELNFGFRTSSRSNDQGLCVEFGDGAAETHGVVALRDSKNQAGPVLLFDTGAASAFIEAIKKGQLVNA